MIDDPPAHAAGGEASPPRRRSAAVTAAVAACGVGTVCVLVSLGVWQVHRLHWKLDLIARVDARIHAPPVAPPPAAAWPRISAAADEYRHVAAEGVFLPGETDVQAVTDLGGGYWVLAPFRTDAGFVVLVNRGFVPSDRRDPARHAAPPSGETVVTGLLRMPEPGGGFLRRNDSAGDRWYSRDVAAIAAARHLGPVAPYFIDAEAAPGERFPVGGLTVVTFPNNHLVYALTWFALAALLAGAGLWTVRGAWRRKAANRPRPEPEAPCR